MKHNPIPKQHELDKDYLKQKIEKIHKILIKAKPMNEQELYNKLYAMEIKMLAMAERIEALEAYITKLKKTYWKTKFNF